ncbi:hypothetical protein PINS_up007585 [Pythium insidiosum]|nr:hypothetical protein PINS_up007585 [Pythium insidiosum]
MPVLLQQQLAAQVTQSSSSSNFVVGAIMGAAVAVAAMAVLKTLQRGRRSQYQRIPDAETMPYSA